MKAVLRYKKDGEQQETLVGKDFNDIERQAVIFQRQKGLDREFHEVRFQHEEVEG